MPEWIRIDDADGERWHRLRRTRSDGGLVSACGLITSVDATIDRRPEAPDTTRCADCLAAAGHAPAEQRRATP
jgi:hypothetical protein